MKKLLPIIILSLSVSAFTQVKPKPKPKPKPKISIIDKPIELSTESFPPNFTGINLHKLAAGMSIYSDQLNKGEFEKTTDYEKRISDLESKPIFDEIYQNSLVGFVTKNLYIKYDADGEILNLKLYTTEDTDKACLKNVGISKQLYFSDCRQIPLLSQTVGESSYIGQNAFGVKKEIKQTDLIDFGLTVVIGSIDVQSRDYFGYAVDLKFTPIEAKRLKDNFRAIIIGELQKPILNKSATYEKPTINSPSEVLTLHHRFVLKIKEIWFFDQQTGRIYVRLHRKDE